MNINREFPTLIDLCFEKIYQIYTQDDKGNSMIEEDVAALVDIIHEIPSSSFKNFKILRLLENRSIALDLPPKMKDKIQNLWSKFSQNYCLRNNNNKAFEPKMLTTELELQNLLKTIARKLKYLEKIPKELDALRKTQIPSEIKRLINSISFIINNSECYETSVREQLIKKLRLIETNTEEKQKVDLINEFHSETNLIFQNISKSLETEAFLYLSRYGDLLKTLKLITDYIDGLPLMYDKHLPSVLLNQIFSTSTFLKEIDLFIDKDPFFSDRHRSIVLEPSSASNLRRFASYKPGLSDQQLRKITKNYTLLEKVKLRLDVTVTENTLKAFLQKFNNTLIDLHLEGINTFEKSTFQDLEFAQLKCVHLEMPTFENGVIDALQAPNLETLELTFAQGNPVMQKLDHLKALNITCPYEYVDQIMQNCLNIKSLEIALNTNSILSLDHLKTIFFKMPFLEKFINPFDVTPNVLSSLVEEIKNAKTFSSQLKLIFLPPRIKENALQDAFSKHHLNPKIVINYVPVYGPINY